MSAKIPWRYFAKFTRGILFVKDEHVDFYERKFPAEKLESRLSFKRASYVSSKSYRRSNFSEFSSQGRTDNENR